MEPTEQNRRAWDEVHRRRSASLGGRLRIPEHVRERLPDLQGRHVLHLQCGTGEETAELADRGALVTGVDFSEEALAVARERRPEIAWVRADVQALPLELRRGRFDLVYTGGGVLTWLHDLDGWAAGIHGALRPGGFLLLYDEHPVLPCLDEFLHWRDDYFDDAPRSGVGWSHFRLEGEPAREQKVERFHRLGEVLTALAQSGLVLRRVEELPAVTSWRRQSARVPGELVVVAARR